MPERRIRAGDVFEGFLKKFYLDDLLRILEDEDEQNHFSLEINFHTLTEEHVEVAEAILASPMKMMCVFDSSLINALASVFEERRCPIYSLKLKAHVRLTGLPRCPEIYRHSFPRSSDVGRLLCIQGTVVRTVSPKMLEFQREYLCLKCKHSFTVRADYSCYYRIAKPPKCLNPTTCYSTNFTIKDPSQNFSHTKDYQEIKLQEQAQKLLIGNIPRSIWVTLEDDLVESVKPGDDVLVCGVVLQRWDSLSKGERPAVDLVVKTNNVTVQNKQRMGSGITKEMKEDFKNFWAQHRYDPLEGRNIILSSFCPQVYGLYVVKLAVAVVVAGGVQNIDPSGSRTRGESHLLLVGDPGTGKSQFLKYVTRLVSRSVLTTGIGTTNAGLTVAAVREEGEWALEAGALVLADGGICCIDEFNSIKEADRCAIHEAMEQQTISVAKAGLVCKLNSRCSILAATNPKGRYDVNESINVNVALASPLLSRFDIILVLLDSRNAEWDKVVSSYILEGRDPLLSGIKKQSNCFWSLERLSAYFCLIKSFQPKMSQDAHLILTMYYKLQRQTDGRNQARTTIRLLESLIRLSQGHSKLLMKEEVEVMDAIVAVTMVEASMFGASLIPGMNPLHTAFPVSPREEYRKQARLVLQTLGLLDVLTSEMTRLNDEEKLLTNATKDNCNEVSNLEHVRPPGPLNSVCEGLKPGLTQIKDITQFRNIVEMDDDFSHSANSIIKKTNARAKGRKSCNKVNGLKDKIEHVIYANEDDYQIDFNGEVSSSSDKIDDYHFGASTKNNSKIVKRNSKKNGLKDCKDGFTNIGNRDDHLIVSNGEVSGSLEMDEDFHHFEDSLIKESCIDIKKRQRGCNIEDGFENQIEPGFTDIIDEYNQIENEYSETPVLKRKKFSKTSELKKIGKENIKKNENISSDLNRNSENKNETSCGNNSVFDISFNISDNLGDVSESCDTRDKYTNGIHKNVESKARSKNGQKQEHNESNINSKNIGIDLQKFSYSKKSSKFSFVSDSKLSPKIDEYATKSTSKSYQNTGEFETKSTPNVHKSVYATKSANNMSEYATNPTPESAQEMREYSTNSDQKTNDHLTKSTPKSSFSEKLKKFSFNSSKKSDSAIQRSGSFALDQRQSQTSSVSGFDSQRSTIQLSQISQSSSIEKVRSMFKNLNDDIDFDF